VVYGTSEGSRVFNSLRVYCWGLWVHGRRNRMMRGEDRRPIILGWIPDTLIPFGAMELKLRVEVLSTLNSAFD
jgi:hypothetical protein